jgi:antitoxin (DNA-binding transcriptional repressor) of toxin-antitoxin stability system
MRNHTPSRGGSARRVVGVRELKTHAAGIVRHVRDSRASYVLTHRGRAVGLILPLEPAEDQSPAPEDAGAAWDAFVRAGRRLARRFRPGVSGVRLLSAERR